jgi:hypothetical protein
MTKKACHCDSAIPHKREPLFVAASEEAISFHKYYTIHPWVIPSRGDCHAFPVSYQRHSFGAKTEEKCVIANFRHSPEMWQSCSVIKFPSMGSAHLRRLLRHPWLAKTIYETIIQIIKKPGRTGLSKELCKGNSYFRYIILMVLTK